MRRDNALIVSLDIGTYKTAVIVAEATPAEVEVIGIGTALSQGLRKSQVVNVEATVQAIRKAVDEAQMGASCEIHNVCAGLTGEHITGLVSQGVVVVKDREVSSADVARVIEVARAIALPSGYEILHVLPQEFLVDGQDRSRDPVGTSGVRLEANVYVVAAWSDAVQTVSKQAQSVRCRRRGMGLENAWRGRCGGRASVITIIGKSWCGNDFLAEWKKRKTESLPQLPHGFSMSHENSPGRGRRPLLRRPSRR